MKLEIRRLLIGVVCILAIATAIVLGYFLWKDRFTAGVAEEKLRASTWFDKPLTAQIELYHYFSDPPKVLRQEHPDIAKLEEAGLVKVIAGPDGFLGPGVDVVLTAEGESVAEASWKRTSDRTYIATTATKEIEKVFNAAHDAHDASCSIRWNWRPTEVGRILGVDVKPKTWRARFAKIEGGWRVKDILAE
jgi:hypothetical protein